MGTSNLSPSQTEVVGNLRIYSLWLTCEVGVGSLRGPSPRPVGFNAISRWMVSELRL